MRCKDNYLDYGQCDIRVEGFLVSSHFFFSPPKFSCLEAVHMCFDSVCCLLWALRVIDLHDIWYRLYFLLSRSQRLPGTLFPRMSWMKKTKLSDPWRYGLRFLFGIQEPHYSVTMIMANYDLYNCLYHIYIYMYIMFFNIVFYLPLLSSFSQSISVFALRV